MRAKHLGSLLLITIMTFGMLAMLPLSSLASSSGFTNGYPSGIQMNGNISEWNGIAPIITTDTGTQNWSQGLAYKGQNGSTNGLWGYPAGVIGIGTTAENIHNATLIKLNNLCRELKALYIDCNDPNWIYIMLKVGGLYPGFNTPSEHPEYNWNTTTGTPIGSPIGYLSYPNVSAYQIYFAVPSSSQQQPSAAAGNHLDFTGTPNSWSFSIQFNGHDPPFVQLANYTSLSLTPSEWAVNITAGAFEMELPRAWIQNNVGPLKEVGVVACSIKPGEASGIWGDWMHTFSPQTPGTPGEVGGAGGLANLHSEPVVGLSQCAGESYADFLANSSVKAPYGDSWETTGYAHVVGWTWVNMAAGTWVTVSDAKTGAYNMTNTYLKGQTFTVDVNVVNPVAVDSYGMDLLWNPAVLNYVGSITYAYNSTWDNYTNDEAVNAPLSYYYQSAGNISAISSALSAYPISYNGTVFLFSEEFKVVGSGPCSTWITPVLDPGFANTSLGIIPVSVQNAYFALAPSEPTASFTENTETGTAGLTVFKFNASASTGYFNGSAFLPITSYAWAFGDGDTATGETASHTYSAAGTYTVTLTVTSGGYTATENSTKTVTPSSKVAMPPAASFTITPTSGLFNVTVFTFDASASTAGWNGTAAVPIANYTWNFGDGNITTVKAPMTSITHVYNEASKNYVYNERGNLTVTLTVMCQNDPTLIADKLTSNSTSKTAMVNFHDVAVSRVTPSPTEVTISGNITVTVVAKDNGTLTESFNVTAYYFNSTLTTIIGTKPVTSLAAGATQALGFVWNTTGLEAGNYTIVANATIVSGDINPANNKLTYGQVELQTKPVTVITWWIWVVIAVIIIIILVVVYFMLTRRKPAQPAK